MPVYCALKRYTIPTAPLNSRATTALTTGKLTSVAVPEEVAVAKSTVATVMSGVPGPAGSTTVSVTSALFTLPAALDATSR